MCSVPALGPCAVLKFVLLLFLLVRFPEKTNVLGQLYASAKYKTSYIYIHVCKNGVRGRRKILNSNFDLVVFTTMIVGWHTNTHTFTLFDSNSQSILSTVPQRFLQRVFFTPAYKKKSSPTAFFILKQVSWSPQQMYINAQKIIIIKKKNIKNTLPFGPLSTEEYRQQFRCAKQ